MLITDDIRSVLAAVRKRGGICIDPRFAGELRSIFENRGLRLTYQRRGGMTVDELAEFLWDHRFTARRLDEVETLDLLDHILRPQPKPFRRRRPRSAAAISADVAKARAKRLRKFVCERCGMIARASKNAILVCGLCLEMNGEINRLVRVDPLPEEIMTAEILAAEHQESAA